MTVDMLTVCEEPGFRVPVFLPCWSHPRSGCVQEILPYGHHCPWPWVSHTHTHTHKRTHNNRSCVCPCSLGSVRVFDFLAKTELTVSRYNHSGTALIWAPPSVRVLVWNMNTDVICTDRNLTWSLSSGEPERRVTDDGFRRRGGPPVGAVQSPEAARGLWPGFQRRCRAAPETGFQASQWPSYCSGIWATWTHFSHRGKRWIVKMLVYAHK